MAISKKIKDEMLQRFQDQYGIMKPALHYNSPFELMIAVILSAQCTDERVNIVTAGMFPEYNTPEKMLTLGTAGLEEKIRTCGLYRSKAKNILANCAILCEKYHGQVPQTFDELARRRPQDGQCPGQYLVQYAGHCCRYPRLPRVQPSAAGPRDDAAGSRKGPAEGHSQGMVEPGPSLAHLAWPPGLQSPQAFMRQLLFG